MNTIKKLPLFFVFLLLFNCDTLQLSDSEIAAGLKSALEVGSNYALKTLGKEDGFLLDQAVKILLPQDVANIVKQISGVPGFGNLIKEIEGRLILTINRAAEASINGVIPIVIDAITGMSIMDAKSILFSSNQIAATDYLKVKTYDPLCGVCRSVIEGALTEKIVLNVSAQDVWQEFTSTYNTVAAIPFVNLNPIETNLAVYTTQKALSGVFLKVGDEEVKIRTDASARINDLLKKVFGQLD
jgi:hypothetical protein